MDAADENSPAENGSDSEVDPDAPRMRVGEDYQAEIPDMLTNEERREECEFDTEPEVFSHVQHWDPSSNLREQEVEEYIRIARRSHDYTMEQAMGVLHYHHYNIDNALQDLPNFTPFPEEWTAEEEVIFQQAFKSHGKSFRRIQSMLTQKSIPELVQYYYKWKKLRKQTSAIDGKTSISMSARADAAGASDVDDEEDRAAPGNSDSDREFELGKDGGRRLGKAKRTDMRLDDIPTKKRLRLPKGMYLDTDALTELALEEDTTSSDATGAAMQNLSAEIVRQREQIRANKQELSELESQQESVEHLRQEFPSYKTTARWTAPELDMAVQCVRRYGKNFDAMAAILQTKTPAQCKNFYMNHHSRLDLDRVYDEYQNAQAGLGPLPSAQVRSDTGVSMENDSQADFAGSPAAAANGHQQVELTVEQ